MYRSTIDSLQVQRINILKSLNVFYEICVLFTPSVYENSSMKAIFSAVTLFFCICSFQLLFFVVFLVLKAVL
jgi:hypothetical protein